MSQIPNVDRMPWPEAVAALDKTAVPKDFFLALPNELRMRAFTIAHEVRADVLQATLDAIKTSVEKGETLWDWRERVKGIASSFTEPDRDWHLQLVYQQNRRMALATGAYQARQETKRAFPYVEYHAGVNPRPSHAALDRRIFAVDDPFLLAHTPPWDFNCNCDLTPRTAAEVGKARAEDQGQPIEKQRVVPGNHALESMTQRGKLPDPVRGATAPIDMRPPIEAGGEYSFRPDRLAQAVDLSGYSAELRAWIAGELQHLGYYMLSDGVTAVPGIAPRASKAELSQAVAAAGHGRGERHVGRPGSRIGRPIALKASNRVGHPKHNGKLEVGSKNLEGGFIPASNSQRPTSVLSRRAA